MSAFPVQKAFQLFYPEYRALHTVTPEQESAAQCIIHCKTGELGYTVSTCPECGHKVVHYASCGNRNCPSCQGTKLEEWVENRSSELIERIPYFHVIMTIPHELNPLFLNNPKELYGLLMKSMAEAVKSVASREEYLGCAPSIVSVLHTWSQNLGFHPHVHLLVAGELKFKSVSDDRFFCPEGRIVGAFREIFLGQLKKLRADDRLTFAGPAEYIRNHYEWEEPLTKLYGIRWKIFVKETFNGRGNAITYLSRYAYRTAISNDRILDVT